MIQPQFSWRTPAPVVLDADYVSLGRAHGVGERLLTILAARGVRDGEALLRFLAPAEDGLHDPRLLPDARAALARVSLARQRAEKVLVYGDFDADGLTGLSIAVIALRRLGLDVEPYVPERLGDGHGLSLRAVERAVSEGRTLIVTADCGTSSAAEIDAAVARDVDVLVTDHHHAATWPAGAVAVVNPQRADSLYPEHGLTGAGVAWKFAHLILGDFTEGAHTGDGWHGALPDPVRDLADLAFIGTVADVAPILGENRSIARLGLERLRTQARPGLAALMRRAGVAADRLDADGIGFAIAPRLNAAGRVGEAARAARLLLTEDPAEAKALAEEIDQANTDRRELTRVALSEAREVLGLSGDGTRGTLGPVGGGTTAVDGAAVPAGAILVRGQWPVGLIGLIAGRLADDLGRPTVVATLVDADAGILRASCRSVAGCNLAETLIQCEDLLIRHGGHAAAAGFDIRADRWAEFEARFSGIVAACLEGAPAIPARPELKLDLVLRADAIDYALVGELALLSPTGFGNPTPTIGIGGFTVSRVRGASGGHTQLVLKRSRDVVDAVAFRRPDLATSLHEGDRIDIAARVASRRFGGIESMQLEVVDVAPEGTQPAMGVE